MELRNSKTKLFCKTSFKNGASKLQNEAFLRDFLQKWSFEAPKRSFSARLPPKMKLRSSKTKLFCETSSKWSFEGLKRRFSARLPSKMMLRSSTTKLFCETSFKNEAAKLKNEAFLRDSLQKWSYETQKRSFSARLPPKIMLRARIGSQATTKGPHHFRVAGVGLRAHLVTCDPIFFTSKRRNSD